MTEGFLKPGVQPAISPVGGGEGTGAAVRPLLQRGTEPVASGTAPLLLSRGGDNEPQQRMPVVSARGREPAPQTRVIRPAQGRSIPAAAQEQRTVVRSSVAVRQEPVRAQQLLIARSAATVPDRAPMPQGGATADTRVAMSTPREVKQKVEPTRAPKNRDSTNDGWQTLKGITGGDDHLDIFTGAAMEGGMIFRVIKGVHSVFLLTKEDLKRKRKKQTAYARVGAEQVSSAEVAKVGGRRAATAEAPFREEGDASKMYVGGRQQEAVEKGPRLTQISEVHGRSLQVGKGVVWQDEHNNTFTQVTIKGASVSKPEVIRPINAREGVEVRGLQESSELPRAIKASEVLRGQHVATETIVRAWEPTELPVDGKLVPMSEFKDRLAAKAGQDTAQQLTTEGQTIREALEGKRWVATMRGVPVSERLVDLALMEPGEELTAAIGNAFLYVNTVEQSRVRRGESESARDLSADNPSDVDLYFTEILPENMATNYARMHNGFGLTAQESQEYGLVHVNAHIGNITTVGSIADLDTVRGEPLGLGDAPVTLGDTIKEFNGILQGSNGFLPPQAVVESLIEDNPERFTKNFVKKYFEERGWGVSDTTIDFVTGLYTRKEYDIDPVELFTFIASVQDDLRHSALAGADITVRQVSHMTRSIMQDEIANRIQKNFEVLPGASDADKMLMQRLSRSYAEGSIRNTIDTLWQVEQSETFREPFIEAANAVTQTPTLERYGSTEVLGERVRKGLTNAGATA